TMGKWGTLYPDAGYGCMFYEWLQQWKEGHYPEPYRSYGNGSAMRVSSAGWLFSTLEETRHVAKLTAEVSHNHPEGIKGADAVASAIFLARNDHSKEEIKDYIVHAFGYDLSRTCDEIRPSFHHIETCQQTVPEAITAFLEGTNFEDGIRTAVSLGGDCDTVTCIAGSIAEAFYGVAWDLQRACRIRLPEDMKAVLDRFEDNMRKTTASEFSGMRIDMDYCLCVPCVHVACGEEELVMDISGGIRQISTSFPRAKAKLLKEWTLRHKEEIIDNHLRVNRASRPVKVIPFE
ncbi:MAG: ADP-ribosylglycohydrolase family protein, partial [Clostridia bacterium]|nr:ADP-ribosylglycohydrolase family protein [Clostridia bacterium]